MKDSNPTFKKVLQMFMDILTGYADLPLLSFDALFPEQAHLDKYLLVLSDIQPSELAGSYNVSDLYCQGPVKPPRMGQTNEKQVQTRQYMGAVLFEIGGSYPILWRLI